MNDQEALDRGLRATAEYRELASVFDNLERGIFEELKTTPIGQDAKVLRLQMMLHTSAHVRKALREMVDNGLIAKAAIEAAMATPD